MLNTCSSISPHFIAQLSDEEDELEEADYSHKVEKVRDYPTINHFQMQEETRSPTPTANSNELATTSSPQENGLTLTFEQEQTADELLADIQNAVDEMLENFQFGPVAPTVPPQPMKKPDTKREKMKNESSVSASAGDDKTNGGSGSATQMAGHTVKMRSRNGGFGFQVMGGMDSEIPAQVDYIVPGTVVLIEHVTFVPPERSQSLLQSAALLILYDPCIPINNLWTYRRKCTFSCIRHVAVLVHS